jgi:ABC-2 type transport system ATP-binding protein
MNAIVIKSLTKKYKDIIAVDDLSLEIEKGTLFSLLGMNGAGKSTTIKMLCCITEPTSGDALILNNSIINDTNKVKNIINLSTQETAVAPNLTVKENLEMISEIYGYSKEETINKVNEIITKFKLESVKNKQSKNLSGGIMRKLSIAMALISDPKILFLDEPTLGLDVIARRELWKIIEELKSKMTIILTTHYMEEAGKLSDKIGIISKGKLVAIGTAKELMKKAKTNNFEDAFIELAGE